MESRPVKHNDLVFRFSKDGHVKSGRVSVTHQDSGLGILSTIMWDHGLWSPTHWDLKPDMREEVWLWPT